MPEERNNGIKLKIFLAVFLVFVSVLFVVYTYNFINVNKDYINQESKISNDCLTMNFDVIGSNYSENNLQLIIINKPTSSSAVRKISIILPNETKSKDTMITPSNIEKVSFDNINNIQDGIQVYPNNCDVYAKTIFVKKQ